ncbi:hypothetical protein PAUR_a4423 [Pseudoalteromonas aurantia 208]|uniref:Transposase n=1 Tax=Pseudoalteromonas aurantia 208 TaxID=1314867 RepID=A0ABR9EFU7_9GAMM|nr:hypothetical protein [Pseudoalteromonas aurantia 208]
MSYEHHAQKSRLAAAFKADGIYYLADNAFSHYRLISQR